MTRIIAGRLKGRRIRIPSGLPVRPTTDRAREALFSMLEAMNLIQDSRILDLCAGTGTFGMECISRGADSVVFVDAHPGVIRMLHENVQSFDIQEETQIFRQDALKFVASYKGKPFRLIFADPPYAIKGLELWPEKICSLALLAPDGILILEHGKEHSSTFADHPRLIRQKNYGTVYFSMFGMEPE